MSIRARIARSAIDVKSYYILPFSLHSRTRFSAVDDVRKLAYAKMAC
jgi:hypothetical protein